jgi:hypothetical protein
MDLERLEPLGVPVPVIHGIDHFWYHSNVALSETGTLAYLPAERVRKAELVWLDRAGKTTPVTHGTSFEPYAFSLSPDGREAAVELIEGSSRGVWIIGLERGSKRLLALEGGAPLFSKDGAFVTYWSSHGTGMEACSRRRADGTGEEAPLHAFLDGRLPRTGLDDRSLLFTAYSSRGTPTCGSLGQQDRALLAAPSGSGQPHSPRTAGSSPSTWTRGGNVFVSPSRGPGPGPPSRSRRVAGRGGGATDGSSIWGAGIG